MFLLAAAICSFSLRPASSEPLTDADLDLLLQTPVGNNAATVPSPRTADSRTADSQTSNGPISGASNGPLSATPANANLVTDAIVKIHKVTPTIYQGQQPNTTELAKLKQAGIGIIINLRNEEVIVNQEARQVNALGMRFVNIPLDLFNEPSESAVKRFLSELDNAHSVPVFIHCSAGQDRTAMMVAIFRIIRQGWSADQAYNEMLAHGFHPGFSRLTQAVFGQAAKAGRPGTAPTGGMILTDLQSRFLR